MELMLGKLLDLLRCVRDVSLYMNVTVRLAGRALYCFVVVIITGAYS